MPMVPFAFEDISNGFLTNIEAKFIGDLGEGLATLFLSCSYYMTFVSLSKLRRMTHAWQVFC